MLPSTPRRAWEGFPSSGMEILPLTVQDRSGSRTQLGTMLQS